MIDWALVFSYAGWGVIVWVVLHGNFDVVRRFDRRLFGRVECAVGAHDWLEVVKYREYLDIHPLVNINGPVRMFITRRWMLCRRCMRVHRT